MQDHETRFVFVVECCLDGFWMVPCVFRDAADAAYYLSERTDVRVSDILNGLDLDNCYAANGLYGAKYMIEAKQLY